ncbi:hypothetical protein C8J56DRAFT_895728 [Mycena floridula]|nr:hypothetical protein C8J56DRAFT_895728 [Mycena floridula]
MAVWYSRSQVQIWMSFNDLSRSVEHNLIILLKACPNGNFEPNHPIFLKAPRHDDENVSLGVMDAQALERALYAPFAILVAQRSRIGGTADAGAALGAASASYVSRPDIVPAAWNISYLASDAVLADGYVFFAPRNVEPAGLMMFEDSGELVNWCFRFSSSNIGGYGKGRVFILNNEYEIVYNFTATNQSDFHKASYRFPQLLEFHINADGSALTTVYNAVDGVDTSGKTFGQAMSWMVAFRKPILRQVKRCLPFAPLKVEYQSGTQSQTRFGILTELYQVNSVAKTHWATIFCLRVIHIRFATSTEAREKSYGNSTFTGDGTNFSWQHDARWVNEVNSTAHYRGFQHQDGQISLYDNAATSWVSDGTQSRGLVIQAPSGEVLLSSSQGNLQLLSDASYTISDNVIMGYGQLPVFAEYTSTGTPLRVVHYGAAEAQGYRVFKNSWVGTPRTAPDVAISENKVYVSWNGATEVIQWSLMQGDAMDSWSNVTNVTRSGFETSITMGSYKVVQLAALDVSGAVLSKSNALSLDGKSLGGAVNGLGSSNATTAKTSSLSNSSAHEWDRNRAFIYALSAVTLLSNIF